MQAIVVLRVQREIILQRDDVAGDVQQPAPHAVAAIGDVGIGQRVLFVAEGPQRKEQVLVAAVAGHDLIRLQPKMGRRCPQQVGTGGVGVKAAFVGVQFDVLLVLRLFARRIGGDSGQGG